MTALQHILTQYRQRAHTEREKGTYFEELIRCYFRHEASYKDLYSHVWLFADWAREQESLSPKKGLNTLAMLTPQKKFLWRRKNSIPFVVT